MKRSVFFISDSTGITAETLGHALLTQFDDLEYRQVTIPFVRDSKAAEDAVGKINAAAHEDGTRPIVFSTLTGSDLHRAVSESDGLVLDVFNAFLRPLEQELQRGSAHATGRFHGLVDRAIYDARISAVDFALKHDDGEGLKGYHDADLILVGVSRSGKTPTCVYLSMQFGVRAANYPFTIEDVERDSLPGSAQRAPGAPLRTHHRARATVPDPQPASSRQPLRFPDPVPDGGQDARVSPAAGAHPRSRTRAPRQSRRSRPAFCIERASRDVFSPEPGAEASECAAITRTPCPVKA